MLAARLLASGLLPSGRTINDALRAIAEAGTASSGLKSSSATRGTRPALTTTRTWRRAPVEGSDSVRSRALRCFGRAIPSEESRSARIPEKRARRPGDGRFFPGGRRRPGRRRIRRRAGARAPRAARERPRRIDLYPRHPSRPDVDGNRSEDERERRSPTRRRSSGWRHRLHRPFACNTATGRGALRLQRRRTEGGSACADHGARQAGFTWVRPPISGRRGLREGVQTVVTVNPATSVACAAPRYGRTSSRQQVPEADDTLGHRPLIAAR